MITPIDIQQMEFTGSFNGFNKKEVCDFLMTVSRSVEAVIKENYSCKKKIVDLSTALEEYKEKDRLINRTLIKVEQVSEEMKDMARKEASLIVKEARLVSENIHAEARKKTVLLESETDAIKKEKDRFLQDIRFIIDRFSSLVDAESKSAPYSVESEKTDYNIR